MADYAAIQAEVFAVEEKEVPSSGLLTRCREVAVELENQGWLVEALHVRTFVGRVPLALNQPMLAR